MQNPLISIIIPTYNRSGLISKTLDSVRAQTYTNWECIVVDDGSTDETEQLINGYIKKDTRFQFHHRPNNRPKGANACRNYGFELSKGKWIQLLDSDDILEVFCLFERLNLVIMNETINLLIRDTALFEKNIKQCITINKDPENKVIEDYLRMFLRYEIPWPIMGAFYKRVIFKECKFDENLVRFQDVSFNIKVLSQVKNLKILRDHKIDSYYRVDKAKIIKKNFVKNVLVALLDFFNIHKGLISLDSYKSDLRKFSNKIFFKFVIPHFNQNKSKSNSVFIWLLKSSLYKINQKSVLLFLMFFLNTNLYNKKGIGMNRFRNYLKKIIDE